MRHIVVDVRPIIIFAVLSLVLSRVGEPKRSRRMAPILTPAPGPSSPISEWIWKHL